VTTSPITVAATTGPTPKISVTVVPDELTAAASFFDLAPLGVQVADVGQQLGGELPARLGGRARWPDLAEDRRCAACGDLIRDPAGHQVAQHRVQPAGDLVAGPGKITMPLRPDLQHRGVTVGDHRTLSPGTQRRHRDGQGIVGVALAGVLGVQQPHPRGQLGLHIQHPLAGGDQLLGQQVAQPRRALHRPDPVRPGSRPGDQLPGLSRAGADPHLAQRLLGRGHRHRGV
jgi:hypothetical protein